MHILTTVADEKTLDNLKRQSLEIVDLIKCVFSVSIELPKE